MFANLTGTIPEAMTSLTKLQVFGVSPQGMGFIPDLKMAGVSGTLPANLTRLTSLTTILIAQVSYVLGVSGISGTLPDFPASVNTLALFGESISGTLPQTFEKVKAFIGLFRANIGDVGSDFNKPLISGTLATNFAASSLHALVLPGCDLSGTLPQFDPGCPVQTLIVENCIGLSGTLPELSTTHTPELRVLNMIGVPLSGNSQH